MILFCTNPDAAVSCSCAIASGARISLLLPLSFFLFAVHFPIVIGALFSILQMPSTSSGTRNTIHFPIWGQCFYSLNAFDKLRHRKYYSLPDSYGDTVFYSLNAFDKLRHPKYYSLTDSYGDTVFYSLNAFDKLRLRKYYSLPDSYGDSVSIL